MKAVKNLFVLYTGGTIGMLQTAEGLAPAGGFEARMREQLDARGVALAPHETNSGGSREPGDFGSPAPRRG